MLSRKVSVNTGGVGGQSLIDALKNKTFSSNLNLKQQVIQASIYDGDNRSSSIIG